MSIYFEAGQRMMFALHGVHPDTLPEKRAAVAAARSAPAVKIALCRMAADFFAACGKQASFEHNMFSVLGKQADWNPHFDKWYFAVVDSLGDTLVNLERAHLEKCAEKRANILQKILGPAAKGIMLTPDVLKTMLAVGGLGGSALGAMNWYVNRQTEEDDAKVEALKAQKDQFERITNDIQHRLQNQDAV